jgi:S-DNA-T family DNA segregation ATPase FtsK/SpoIIIE
MRQSDSGLVELVGLFVAGFALLVWFVWRHPRLLVGLVAITAAWWLLRVPGALSLLVGVGVLLVLWRLVHRRSFRRWISAPLARARCRHRYRRTWPSLMAAHRLSWAPHPKQDRNSGGLLEGLIGCRPAVPKLGKIELGAWVDRLHARILPGQVPADWEGGVEGIGHALGARDARVRVIGPGRIILELAFGDPLAAIVPAVPVDTRVDLWALPIGMAEDGRRWNVRLAGSHVLVAGATGAGKGSVLASLMRATAPAVSAGLVQLHGIDPKGGMEFLPSRALFTRLAVDDFAGMADLLDHAVVVMQARARRLAGRTRKHEPTTDEPLIVVLIDELATLIAYLPDRKLSQRITQALALLLTKGRAVGVVVVAALQDPRKEVVPFRNLFPTRIALRLDDASHVDMVLGDGARDQGARCDLIPASQPGLAYVREDGRREPTRVRAAWVSDAELAEAARTYPAAGHADAGRGVA